MTPSKYITIEVIKLDEILTNARMFKGVDGEEMAIEIKEALIENAVDSETFITYSVKQNPLYKQMMDWVHGKGEFDTATNDLYTKNAIGVDVMKNEYQNIPIKSDNNDTK